MKISLSTLLFLIFLVLKLTHVINWPYVWVTSPLWIGLGLWAAIIVGAMVLIAFFDSK